MAETSLTCRAADTPEQIWEQIGRTAGAACQALLLKYPEAAHVETDLLFAGSVEISAIDLPSLGAEPLTLAQKSLRFEDGDNGGMLLVFQWEAERPRDLVLRMTPILPGAQVARRYGDKIKIGCAVGAVVAGLVYANQPGAAGTGEHAIAGSPPGEPRAFGLVLLACTAVPGYAAGWLLAQILQVILVSPSTRRKGDAQARDAVETVGSAATGLDMGWSAPRVSLAATPAPAPAKMKPGARDQRRAAVTLHSHATVMECPAGSESSAEIWQKMGRIAVALRAAVADRGDQPQVQETLSSVVGPLRPKDLTPQTSAAILQKTLRLRRGRFAGTQLVLSWESTRPAVLRLGIARAADRITPQSDRRFKLIVFLGLLLAYAVTMYLGPWVQMLFVILGPVVGLMVIIFKAMLSRDDGKVASEHAIRRLVDVVVSASCGPGVEWRSDIAARPSKVKARTRPSATVAPFER